MKFPVKNLLTCFYFGIFSYTVYISTQKYLERSTTYHSTLKDAEKVEYPSISVCAEYTYKNGSIARKLFCNKSLTETKALVLNSVWNKGQIFNFVSHPDMFGFRYPCVSINDGSDPGKPCSFPFGLLSCHQGDEIAPFCFTRVPESNNSSPGSHGACTTECKGEMTGPNSTFNLVNQEYGQAWEENLYDLGSFGAGYCYTYNPPKMSGVEFEDRLFMLLGNRQMKNLIGFIVYLHEKDQFWPRQDMNIIGKGDGKRSSVNSPSENMR